jgi:hypothetical protein
MMKIDMRLSGFWCPFVTPVRRYLDRRPVFDEKVD